MRPQSFPCAAQVVGVQGAAAQVFEAVQTFPLPQVPQSSVPPQPSGIVPQVLLSYAQVVRVQPAAGVPHTFAVPPPPQVWPWGQLPQSSFAPQPSSTWPQLFPSDWQVAGWHAGAPQALAVPPPPHVWPSGHPPHWRNPPGSRTP
jgi:hypothetical protein